MKRTQLVLKLLCFIMVYILSSESSAMMRGLSTEELTRGSEIIIRGEVGEVKAQWSNDGKTIFTSASVIISEVIKGEITQTNIIVEYKGGEVGDIGLKVSDVSQFRKREKIILFLKTGKSKKDGIIYNVVGQAQGKYIIGKDGIARKSGYSIVSGEEIVDNNIAVDDLINKIRRVKSE